MALLKERVRPFHKNGKKLLTLAHTAFNFKPSFTSSISFLPRWRMGSSNIYTHLWMGTSEATYPWIGTSKATHLPSDALAPCLLSRTPSGAVNNHKDHSFPSGFLLSVSFPCLPHMDRPFLGGTSSDGIPPCKDALGSYSLSPKQPKPQCGFICVSLDVVFGAGVSLTSWGRLT